MRPNKRENGAADGSRGSFRSGRHGLPGLLASLLLATTVPEWMCCSRWTLDVGRFDRKWEKERKKRGRRRWEKRADGGRHMGAC